MTRSRALETGDRAGRVDDELAFFRIGRRAENPCQLNPFRRLQRARDELGAARFAEAPDACLALQFVEEILHGDTEDLRHVIEPARADPIRSLLVFLYLLKGDAEQFAQLLLAHADQQPAHPHAISDMAVDKVWIAFCHFTQTVCPRSDPFSTPLLRWVGAAPHLRRIPHNALL